jgi:hypothetical protein
MPGRASPTYPETTFGNQSNDDDVAKRECRFQSKQLTSVCCRRRGLTRKRNGEFVLRRLSTNISGPAPALPPRRHFRNRDITIVTLSWIVRTWLSRRENKIHL